MKKIKNLGPLRVFSHAGWRFQHLFVVYFPTLGKTLTSILMQLRPQAARIAAASHAEPVFVDS